MKGFVKALLVTLAILAGVVIAASAWFALAFDPNDFRDEIAALALEYTGRELVIEGDLALTYFPIGFEVGPARLAQAPGLEGEPFARLTRATAQLRVLPLLRRRIEIRRLEIEGLALALERRAEGANWEDLLRRASAHASQRPGGDALPLGIGSLRIADASVRYVDRQVDREYRVDDFSLRTGRFVPGLPFDFEAAFRMAYADVAAEVEARGEAVLETARNDFELHDPTIDVALAGPAKLVLKAEADVARHSAGTLSVDAPRVTLQGQDERGTEITGVLRAQSLTLAAMDALEAAEPVLEITLDGAAVPGGRAELTAQAPVLTVRAAARTLTIDEIHGEAYGLAFLASAHAASDAAPGVAGRLEVEAFSPRELLGRMGLADRITAAPDVLTHAELTADYALGAESLRLHDVRLRLDDTTLTGEVEMPDLAAGAVRFDLTADRLAVDRYLGEGAETSSERADPLHSLSTLPLEGTLRIGEAQLGGVSTTDLVLAVRDD